MVFGLFFVWCKKNSLEVQVDDLVKKGFHCVDHGLSIGIFFYYPKFGDSYPP